MNKNYTLLSSLTTNNENIWKNESLHLASEGAMRAWLLRNLTDFKKLIVILPNERQVRDFYEDSLTLDLFNTPEILPEISFSEDIEKIKAVKISRGTVLKKIDNMENSILIATPTSLMSPYATNEDEYLVKTGEDINRNDFITWLTSNGYHPSDLVWVQGQFAVRGSIIDVFSPADRHPTRIEFFDDTVESIRFYDSETQRSVARLNKTSFVSIVQHDDKSLEKYFDEDTYVVFFNPKAIENSAENALWLWNTLNEGTKSVLPVTEWETLYNLFGRCKRIRVVPDVYTARYRTELSLINSFKGKTSRLLSYINEYQSAGYTINICTENKKNIAALQENSKINIIDGILSEGFIDPSEKTIYLSDLELSGVVISHHRTEQKIPVDWSKGLTAGQWVVHDDYGIGKYLGIESIERDNTSSDYIVLEYAEERRLLLPVMQMAKISPWDNISGDEPKADNLKSSVWKKNSEKAKALAEKAAKELVEIYAKREMIKGHQYSENETLMKEIENSFPYTETVDQLRTIDEIKTDMMSPLPMDRLVVGDVGFGKTEIAIRAAARAVFDGKQVALMVPTTLLAHQHYDTFITRFTNVPVRIAVISRFVSMKEQKQIVEDLKCGKIDIVIGTQRLISSDIGFKNLGLVIIDEEHRFGVMNKEHMKQLAPDIDVLMLSATPIPRSLSMSLSGLRDISILETPPSKRLPVITVVRPWSEELLKKAVLKEINRGGQIFFVHNRINGIQKRVTLLKRLFPKLRIALIHSKMQENEIENAMLDFSAEKTDILVSTTIIESGIDIQSANTLIVDDAHELGLAQMYQLRGRVGRSEEQAYAFLMYPADANLTNESIERLDAIAELDELGSGYKLAQRDLQIRGGGELIGLAQHGNINRVGYPKYCELLSQEIARIKGKVRREPDVIVSFPAIIPPEYIPQENVRVIVYRRLSRIIYPEEAIELENELIDRFGKLPKNMRFMLNLAFLKSISDDLSITKIQISRDETVIIGSDDGKWSEIPVRGLWFRRSNGYIGKGGIDSFSDFAEAVKEKYRAEE